MPSPFPGMNPYLEKEDAWSDFHERFIPAAAEEIGKQVRPAYIVKIEQNVYVQELPEGERTFLGRPDAYVGERDLTAGTRAATATLNPPARAWLVPLTFVVKESFLEIRDLEDRKVVTAIELLSPSNKLPGPNRAQHLSKRNQYLHSGVHLVEIDLLRAGSRVPLDPPIVADYCVVVSRAEERPAVDLWPIRLRESLPVIPIPLRSPTGDALLNMKAVLDRVYDAAGYEDYIYGTPPDPLLLAADDAWATEIVQSARASRRT